MAILNIQLNEPGQSGIYPRIIRIETNDPVATVVASGYLTNAVNKGLISLDERDMALVVTKESASAAAECGWYEISYSSGAWSLVPPASPGDVVLPSVANRLAHFTNTTGTLSGDAADVTNLGDMTLGASGTEGILNLYPSTASKGSLIVKAIDNTGDTSVTVSNAAHGQATVISIPDGGQATAEFIISDSAGTQHITSGAFQVDAGAISSGLLAGGSAGQFIAWANTTLSGNLQLLAVDNASGDFDTIISNAAAVGQDQTITIPDVGQATGQFMLSQNAVDPGSNLVWVDVSGTFADLSSAGKVEVAAAAAGKSYRIRDVRVNYDASGLSGGGGDRLIVLSDGTTTWNGSGITAALLGSPVNTIWGGSGNPLPGSVAMNTASVAGAQIYFQYSGGSSDYTSGNYSFSVLLERVA